MKIHRILIVLVLVGILIIGCSKDDTTSTSKLPYFESALQIAQIGIKDHNIAASITVIDPKGLQVSAKFDWGDGTISDYSGFVDSGAAIIAEHIYTQTGFFNVKAYAKNESNLMSSGWSAAGRIQVLKAGEPYVQGITQSKTEMVVGNQITVTATPEDISGFQVQARVDWGDGMISAWSDLTIPSVVHTFTHNFNLSGEFQIKIQAKSSLDSLSVWYNTPSPLQVYNIPAANDMVVIPGGTFVMGSITPLSLPNEAPLDTVDVASFYMSQYEISQAEWQTDMGNNPAYFALNGEIYAPVENVDWYDCIVYCNKRSIRENLTPCYTIDDSLYTGITDPASWPPDWKPAYPDTSMYQVICDFDASGYRLPTETEWEYAAKAGTNSIYSGTSDISQLVEYAWYGGSPYQTHIVGLKAPNAWGLYDMTGNVWEWCWNSYRMYPGSTTVLNAANRSLKITRGASFNSNNGLIRVAYRNMIYPSTKTLLYGFRVVKKI